MRKRKYDLFVDFDTPLVSAAATQQENTILVTHIQSGRKKHYSTRTDFKNWLKENPKWKPSQFEIEDCQTVVGSVRKAVDGLLARMSDIADANPVKTVRFGLGGPYGNFRDKVARIQPYKGQRPAKPLLFNAIKERLIKEIGSYIVQPSTNIETDDIASIWLYEHKEFGEDSERSVMHCDKDLNQCVGWHSDWKRWDAQPSYVKDFDAFYHMCWQSLRGDACDNIQGIPYAVESVVEKFGLRRGKGFGEVSATKCLSDCTTKEQLAQRVAWIYRETFQDGLLVPDGGTMSWIEVMDENMQLLKMLDYVGQQYKFSEEWNIK
jgi:hypothetical protein